MVRRVARNRKRYKGIGVLDGTMESKISGIVSRFDPEPKIKKSHGRFYLASAQLEGRLSRAAR